MESKGHGTNEITQPAKVSLTVATGAKSALDFAGYLWTCTRLCVGT